MMHTDISQRKSLEEDLSKAKADLSLKIKERTDELEVAKEQLQYYTREIIRVQEEERKRIALELHDETAQNLALLTLELDSIINGKANLPDNIKARLKRLRDDTDYAQKEVRRFSHELRPGSLDYLGLEAALEGLVTDLNAKGPVEMELEIKGKGQRLAPEAELNFFRIAQEASNNSRKHSQASKVIIELKFQNDKVILTVSDNGKGFNMVEDAYQAIKKVV